MRVKSVSVKQFKRFTDLEITNLPESARLVVLIGRNGSGKTSLFEAFNIWWQASNWGYTNRPDYFPKRMPDSSAFDVHNQIKVQTESHQERPTKDAFYFRSAYRHEAEFKSQGIQNIGEPSEDRRKPERLTNTEERVSDNFQRLVGTAIGELFGSADGTKPISEVRERLIGNVRRSMSNVFGDLLLKGIGSPTQNGTFLFSKGTSKDFEYVNLSGGEKAAFDLLLDLVIKTEIFTDTVYCIDEPELHMNSRLQTTLLSELYNLMPEACQL